jgi:hypothetical protein
MKNVCTHTLASELNLTASSLHDRGDRRNKPQIFASLVRATLAAGTREG